MKPEPKAIIMSFVPGFCIVCLLFLVYFLEQQSEFSFVKYGLYPRSTEQLTGIITYPMVHKDFEHLFSNALPIFILAAMLRYFYNSVFWNVFLLNWILGGIWLWLGGRPSFHIGASGWVYGLASFLFFSGIWRWERRTMAVSMIIVFLYGGMVWGLFPFFKDMSWEGHLFGGMSGLLLSWIYRKREPQRIPFDWENEEEKDTTEIFELPDDTGDAENDMVDDRLNEDKQYVNMNSENDVHILQHQQPQLRYIYKAHSDEEKEKDTDNDMKS